MQPEPTLEKEIIDLVKGDFELGARKLVDTYGEYLVDKAIFLGLEQEDAEETASDVLLNSIEKISDGKFVLEREGSLKGWLYISLRNKCRDFYDRVKNLNKKISVFSLDEAEMDSNDEEGMFGNLKSVFDHIISKLEENIREDDRKKIISDALGELSGDELFCVKCYLDNIRHQEIAQMLKIGEDAAKQRVRRALKALCSNIAGKLNLDFVDIYERLKKIHKQDTEGRIAER